MPDIKDIDELKNTINSLGNENGILAERGESIEDIPMPETGLSDDLNELLGSVSDSSEDETFSDFSDISALMDESGEPSVSEADDLSSNEDFSAMTGPEEVPEANEINTDLSEESSDEPASPEQTESGLSFEDESAEPDLTEDIAETDEFALPDDFAFTDNEAPAEEEIQEAPESVDDFSLPDGLLDGDNFELPDETEEASPVTENNEITDNIDFEEALNAEADESSEESNQNDFQEAALNGISENAEEPEIETAPEESFSMPDDFQMEEEIADGENSEEAVEASIEEPVLEAGSEEIEAAETQEEEIFEEVFEEELEEEPEEETAAETVEPEEETEEVPVEDGYSLEDIQAAIAEESAISSGEQAPPVQDFNYDDAEDEDELSFDDISSSEEAPPDEFSLPVGFPFSDSGEAVTEGEAPAEDQAAVSDEAEADIPQAEEAPTEDFELADISDEGFSIPEGLGLGDEDQGSDDESFSLGTLGEEFLGADFSVNEDALNPANDISGELYQADEGLDLSDQDFEDIKARLSALPRNLKLVIEELIGEKGLSGDNLKKLVGMLIEGVPLKTLASFAGRLAGKKIKIPAYYEKRTALEYQLEKASFTYRFIHVLLPKIAIGMVIFALCVFVYFMTFEFVYKPIHAAVLYHKGLKSIEETKYTEGNQYFEKALNKWKVKSQFFKYAESFIDKKQYRLAAEKYDQLLYFYPVDKKGILKYADLESVIRNDYPKADGLLKQLLFKDIYNFDALLAAGDNYLEWAKQDGSKYEDARKSYALLLEKYGRKPRLLFGMMKYFMRTDKYNEVISLKQQFQDDEKIKVDPQVYAELGAYLIDKKDYTDVRTVLFRAMKIDNRLPEIHYQLARFYKIISNSQDELGSLKNTAFLMERVHKNTVDRLEMHVDTYNRLGENYFNSKEYLESEKNLQKAASLYEAYKDSDFRIEPKDKFGKIYSNLGDIYYFVSGDYDLALNLYNKAEDNAYLSDEMEYKRGYIYYSKKLYKKALNEFYNAADPFDKSSNVILSTADTLYKRSDYFAAEGYYRTLINDLETRKNSIPVLRPSEKIDHRILLEDLMKAYNNLGVTLYHLSLKTKNKSEKYSQALVYLTESSEIYDNITRDPESLERANTINLAYLNTRAIIYPSAENVPEIYSEIPKEIK